MGIESRHIGGSIGSRSQKMEFLGSGHTTEGMPLGQGTARENAHLAESLI